MKLLRRYSQSGFTMVELLIAMVFFGVLMGALYGTFNLISVQVGKISTDNGLSDKGQRILAFMEEDIRMIGHLLPSESKIPICTGNLPPGVDTTNSNLITFNNADPYDALSFITSEPVLIKDNNSTCMSGQTDAAGVVRSDYYLTTVGTNQRCSNDHSLNCNVDADCPAVSGTPDTCVNLSEIEVDAGVSCYPNEIAAVSGSNNGRSLITFEFADKLYYTLASIGNKLTITETPDRRIQDNATVYGVRQYSYQVTTTGGKRNLIRNGWDDACATGGDVSATLLATADPSNNGGGVDALQYEFTSINTDTGQLVTTSTLPEPKNLKYIRIWLLLRAERAEKGYKDTATYALGSALTKGPYNDSYRRVLVNKIVEVRNLAPISH